MSTARPLTPDEEREATAQEERDEILSGPSSYRPWDSERVLTLLREGIHVPVPSIFRRDDGAALIYPGRTHTFYGQPESCKTWVALVMIAQEIRAGNAALFFDYEDEIGIACERLLQLGLSNEEIAAGFLYAPPDETWNRSAHLILDYVIAGSTRPITVAVIDSMTEALSLEGLDPDRGVEVTAFYKRLPLMLTGAGIAVVTIDHVVKSGKGGR